MGYLIKGKKLSKIEDNTKELDYSQNINSLNGLSERNKIRDKAPMYLGGTNQETGMLTFFREPLDNSIDEFNNLKKTKNKFNVLKINIDTKNIICSVRDYGRGIPYVLDEKGVSLLEKAFTILHMGGKHNNNSKHLLEEDLSTIKNKGNYEFSSGINGIGSKINSYASRFFHSVVFNEIKNEKAYISFDDGYVTEFKIVPLNQKIDIFNKEIDSFVLSDDILNKDLKRGSLLVYQPSVKEDEFDEENVLDVGVNFNKDAIINQLKTLPYLNPGLRIELNFDGEEITFEEKSEFKDVIDDYAEKSGHKKMIDTIYFKEHMVFAKNLTNNSQPKVYSLDKFVELPYSTRKNFKVIESVFEIAFSFVEGTEVPFQENTVNGSIIISGGKQKTSLESKMQHYINQYINENMKSVGRFDKEDIILNLSYMFQVKINEPKFAGQNKSKLDNSELTQFSNYFFNKFLKHWINREDKDKLKKLIQLLEANRKARISSNKIREDVFKEVLNQSDDALLMNSTKLTKCKSKNPELCELFLVEGDSALGPVKDSRVSEYQAVLPLKGKLINALKTKKYKSLLQNQEIINLITALGCSIGEGYDYTKLNYSKILLLADSDVDGLHIKNLNLIFLYKFYKELIEKGHVYIVNAPLYAIKTSKETFYAWDIEERNKITEDLNVQYEITRYKGLGEMNPEQLYDTCLNKENRKLYQITLSDFEGIDIDKVLDDEDYSNNDYEKLIDIYMNDGKEEIEIRKELINKYYSTPKENIISLTGPEI